MAGELTVSIVPGPTGGTYVAALRGDRTTPLSFVWTVAGHAPVTRESPTFQAPAGLAVGTRLTVTVSDASTPTRTGTAETSTVGPVIGERDETEGEEEAAEPAETGSVVWSTSFALGSGIILTGVYLVTIIGLWLALRPRLGAAAGPPFAAAIAAALIAVAVLALLGGVYLGLLAFRGKAKAVDTLPRTPNRTMGADGELGASILENVDLEKVLKQFRLMSSQIAVLTVALVCVIGAIVITLHAETAAKPTSPAVTRSVSPGPSPSRTGG